MHAKPAALLHPALVFSEAFELWIAKRTLTHETLQTNARYISRRTQQDYRNYARSLERFFLGMPLGSIRHAHIETYQRERAFNTGQRWANQAGANLIRSEVGILLRMLRDAGCWSEEDDQRLERVQAVDNDVPRAMSPAEQLHFLRIAGSRDRWSFVYAYAILALQTTASTNELRALRLADISLDQGVIKFGKRAAKNRHRLRTVPIETLECRWAVETLMFRAMELGSSAPHHCLFPFRERAHVFDPTRPMGESGLKKRWAEVRTAAGLPWLRPYDLRHTAITRLAEEGVPIATIMSLAGHIGIKMQQHYTTISMMAKRKSVASTWSASVPRPNYGIHVNTVQAG